MTPAMPLSAQSVKGVLNEAGRDLVWFAVKQARACVFAGLFFLAVFLMPRAGLFDLPRYDVLLAVAVAIQIVMVALRIETWDELKAIMVFHLVGFVLEVFKTSTAVHAWTYPDFAYTKLFGVPLFSGFMYASVGSYMTQSWRLLDLRIRHHPPYWMAGLVAGLIYVNFFTHTVLPDLRWYLAAGVLGLYARATVIFRPRRRDLKMPLVLSFILIGFFLWLAENISTFYGLWRYPNQLGAWSAVHVGKWSSWSLLAILTFTLVANLKHIKAQIHVPE